MRRPEPADEDEVDIHEGLESTLTLIRRRHASLVRCYPSRLNQVYMNLLVNAEGRRARVPGWWFVEPVGIDMLAWYAQP